MTTLAIRPATPQDASEAVAVLRESITLSCVDDHHNDRATLEAWLHNKTVAEFEHWLDTPERSVFVAECRSSIGAVGAVHRCGELRQLYVRPDMQRMGLGGALLEALEAAARDWGLTFLQLGSSSAARGFYERFGYVPSGDPIPGFGLSFCFPYRKRLAP